MKKVKLLFFSFLVFVFLLDNISFLKSQPKKNQTIIILLNCISLQDFFSLPAIDKNAPYYTVSLMNLRTYGKISLASSVLGLATSSRATANEYYAKKFFNFNEYDAVEKDYSQNIFYRNNGFKPDNKKIFNTNFFAQTFANKTNLYFSKVLLGDILKAYNLKRYYFGNNDTPFDIHRESALLITDSQGLIDGGEVNKNISEAQLNYPYGIKTNYENIYKQLSFIKDDKSVIIFDCGDLSRLENYSESVPPVVYQKMKQNVFKELNIFLEKVFNYVNDSNYNLIVFSAYPDKNSRLVRNYLVPVLVKNKNYKQGVLISYSTRQTGLISHLDFLPLILNVLEIENTEKNKIEIKPQQNSITYLQNFFNKLTQSEETMPYLLQELIIYQLIILIFAFVILYFKLQNLFTVARIFLLSTVVFPFCLLVLPIFDLPYYLALVFCPFLALLLTAVSFKIIPQKTFIFLLFLNIIFILIDVLFLNSYFMKFSPLGFSLIRGDRFYGIGNEYVAVLVSAVALSAGYLFNIYKIDKLKIIISIIIFFIIYFATSFTKLGANFGGGVTVFFTLAIFLIHHIKQKFTFLHFVVICFLFLFFQSILLFFDIKSGEKASHLGQLFNNSKVTQNKNPNIKTVSTISAKEKFIKIIQRKILTNFKLVRFTRWNTVFIPSVIILLLLFFNPSGKIQQLKNKYPAIYSSFYALGIGGFIGFLVNDSGIIILAICTVGIAVMSLYLLLGEN